MKYRKQYTIPIFVPHLGCGFDCVFCNQDKITGVSTNISGKDVKSIIEKYLNYFNESHYIEVGFFGGSFTGIEIKKQKELLDVAKEFKDAGKIDGIRLSTRPDFIDKNRLEILKEYDVDTIELGVQSLDETVLELSGRGHNTEIVYKSIRLIKKFDFKLGLQMMIGLPGDTFKKSYFTAKEFVRLKPDCIRIYPTLVIRDTKLEEDYRKGIYKPLNLEESVEIVTPILMLFESNNMNVIRVGLQVTKNIQLGKDVVAGPFHSAYRQLVESNIYKILIDNILKNYDKDLSYLEIRSSKKNISNIVGNKKENLKYLRKNYNIKKIKMKNNENIKGKDMIICLNEDEMYIDYFKLINSYLKGEEINAT